MQERLAHRVIVVNAASGRSMAWGKRKAGMPGKAGHVEHEVEKRHSGGVPNRLFVLVVEVDNFIYEAHVLLFYKKL
jgi:hypothetical protein